MASIYFRGNNGSGAWWIKYYPPGQSNPARQTLGTGDPAIAELLRRRVELEIALRQPAIASVTLPANVAEIIGIAPPAAAAAPATTPPPPSLYAPVILQTTIPVALKTYFDFVRSDNVPHNFDGKLSVFRQFFGAAVVDAAAGIVSRSKAKPFFEGKYLTEILPGLVQGFIEDRDMKRKTNRHYREDFHHLFEVCLRFNLYTPLNLYAPNPMGALPSYGDQSNHKIIFLDDAAIVNQLAVLASHRSLHAAAMLMIHAGLRRSEALWLTRDAVDLKRGILSIINRDDPESDSESSLKTGSRSVIILPPLREFLEAYLPALEGKWLIPSPTGKRWIPDNYSDALRATNRANDLPWTTLHYRHTYATRRAREGWSLFTIAKQMGNSALVVESNYAAFVAPSGLIYANPEVIADPASAT